MTTKAHQLAEMLTYRRPHDSQGELDFIARYIDSVPGMAVDNFGNRWCIIGDTGGTLFSCHTDTVHRDGREPITNKPLPHVPRQSVQVDEGMTRIFKEKGTGCLGADDGVGVYLLLSLIKANVPGLYIFHRAEEIGGCGSEYIAEDTFWKAMFETLNIKRAIAFDRRGTTDVITHQGFGRCCSDAFATELAEQLGMGFQPEDSGVFTDTANYTGIIPECTNISCGYENEHSDMEYVDVTFVMQLEEALLKVKWSELGTYRDPSVEDYGDFSGLFSSWSGHTTRKGITASSAMAVQMMGLDELTRFLKFCRITDDDVDDFLYSDIRRQQDEYDGAFSTWE